ncbi:hypothetical protein [Dokdonella koreensis]|uniref:Uncharacterized protein n=1 Tax=Dokdonella koreensis DS-123 TaxID=1300342 RepID=A0A160DS59_9GAMM|nr:hypothetical protein [Dokdonella koreensis]ANB17099.1 Hypothetical protein I596_1069 [Dokdonella koreensis DS-123]
MQSVPVSHRLLGVLFTGAGMALALPVAAAWSTDPALNLPLADRAGEEVQAKILPRSDGGFYVSWFDNTDGGYDLRLQRLDVDGNELWPHGGLRIADRSYSSTTDYGFDVDAAGDALLSFQCCTQGAGDERIVVAKVSAAGNLAWGAGGIAVSTLGEGAVVSYVTATADGGAVAAWVNDAGQGRLQKLDTGGAPLWTAQGVTLPGPASGLKFLSDVKGAGAGDAIVAWSNQSGATRILRAQKLASADGAVLWGTDGVRVADVGNLQAGYFPKIIADGAGGAVFAYYDISGVAFNVRVQHLDAAGNRLFGNDGALATTDASKGHFAPSASYDPATGTTHLIWIDGTTINQQSYDGLYAQRIDAAGLRQWGDAGRELVPMTISTDGAHALSQLVALPAPGGLLASWVTGNTAVAANPISSVRLDAAGSLVWPAVVHVKDRPTRTSRLAGATSTAGYAALVWSDGIGNDSATQDVLAQNLSYAGQLGPVSDTLFTDGFDP